MRAFNYKGWDLFDAIDALSAFDHGARDSGAHDPDLKAAVFSYLKGVDDKTRRIILAEYARKFLTDEALSGGYGVSDVCSFVEWLSENDVPIL
jgi:hypothetical protein